jgi:hypothetical protein
MTFYKSINFKKVVETSPRRAQNVDAWRRKYGVEVVVNENGRIEIVWEAVVNHSEKTHSF